MPQTHFAPISATGPDLIGTAFDDTLLGSDGDDDLQGLAGQDKLRIELKYGDLNQRVLAIINFFKELS